MGVCLTTIASMNRIGRIVQLFCVFLGGVMVVESASPPVVLDIGHQTTAGGAQTPDGKINEFAFWLRYAGEVQKMVQDAGYGCILTNRGNPPAKGTSEGVLYMKHPDKNAMRYPSRHYPEYIGAGMICADYAIDIKARCVVFLHLNCTTGKWSSRPPKGLIICNRIHGLALAESICQSMREVLLDKPGGIPNAGKGIKVLPRYIGSQPSAGWMNALDEAGIPAAVFEAVYMDNRAHAAFISNDANARKLARTIGQGIVRWLSMAKEASPGAASPSDKD